MSLLASENPPVWNRSRSESAIRGDDTFQVAICTRWCPGHVGTKAKPYPTGQYCWSAFTANTSTCSLGQPWIPRHARCRSMGVQKSDRCSIRAVLQQDCPSAYPSITFQEEPNWTLHRQKRFGSSKSTAVRSSPITCSSAIQLALHILGRILRKQTL